ncbi:MAG: G5 domain-containing protein [Patescibacteria group bacterium]
MSLKIKHLKSYLFLLLILGVVFYFIFKEKKPVDFNFENNNKKIILVDDGMNYQIPNVSSSAVKDFISEKKIMLGEKDYVFPSLDSKIYDNSQVIIERNKNISILVDGKKIEGKTLGNNVAMALWDNNVKLGEDDFSSPLFDVPIKDKSKIEVIRVDIRKETANKEVNFEKISTEDDKLSWRIKKISQKGIKGIDEYKYRVVSHNGKEISRKLLSKERTKDPVPEISVQGTFMKLGKAKTGQGTWYAFKGGLFAASLTIPRGGYAKVTNTENGKTVVVQINDAGPYGKGRIIDLDKVAFEKIADLGAGVIGVKVEQVLN